jgi:hypothetical protein
MQAKKTILKVKFIMIKNQALIITTTKRTSMLIWQYI